MKKIAIIFHSDHGHTEFIARQVQQGAREVEGIEAELVRAEDLRRTPEALLDHDAYILGSPTYLGGVSGPFKSFMDATGGLWAGQRLRGRLAAGFTVSSLPAGDKQSTLLAMFVFAMQHGLVWVGNPILPEQHRGVPYDEAANRLGSWSGLMAQAGHASAPDAFVPGDVKTARLFGRHVAQSLQRWHGPERIGIDRAGSESAAPVAEAAP